LWPAEEVGIPATSPFTALGIGLLLTALILYAAIFIYK
jgi:preprotein translocase subunit Sec61beta